MVSVSELSLSQLPPLVLTIEIAYYNIVAPFVLPPDIPPDKFPRANYL